MQAQTTTAADLADLFGEPISTYTRAEAIKDGALIDVSATAREAGIVWPMALTSAAWADCVAWTDADEKRKGHPGQSESGRLWDVVWMARIALRAMALMPAQQARVFGVLRSPRAGRAVKPRLARLLIQVGPDDDGKPCLTITMPGEN